jgi:hypothetical protein
MSVSFEPRQKYRCNFSNVSQAQKMYKELGEHSSTGGVEAILCEMEGLGLDNDQNMEITAEFPEMPSSPFATYYYDSSGRTMAAYGKKEPAEVHDLTGIPRAKNTKYGQKNNREWVEEHDLWRITTSTFSDIYPDHPIASLDKRQWLESRIYTLHQEIMAMKETIAQKKAIISRYTTVNHKNQPFRFNAQAPEFVTSW